uniref:Uncharacterized protein Escp99 n=2 Tax=Ectocarpus siliculosus TaxID=2880 RepID=D1J755_ECTSI|nr:hypothetical protein GFC16_pgp083 [Ectocarpus siliculosus]CAT18771.1 Chloroplast hypothetical protein [Ectocarpus siliculosus]CAV31239.1 Chloroplast hypothetical protein [Ectocarpus siliculosus]
MSNSSFVQAVSMDVLGTISSGTAILTSFNGILIASLVGYLGTQGFNELGKYPFTDPKTIADLLE